MSHDRDVQRPHAEAERASQLDEVTGGGDRAAQRASGHQMGQVSGRVTPKEAPTQTYADQSLLHAIQAHVKLTSARMYAGAARIRGLLESDTSGPAGTAPMLQMLEQEIAIVDNDLSRVLSEIQKVPDVVRNALDDELGMLQGAFHDVQGWANAVNKVYHRTQGMADAKGLALSLTPQQDKLKRVFALLGKDPGDVRATYKKHISDPAQQEETRDEELKSAELEALGFAMHSVEVAVDLIKADLPSSMQDQSKEALSLTTSVETLVAMFEPIDPAHIGKMTKLPALLKKIEALQHEVMSMKDAGIDKAKALAPKIGTNTQLSSNVYALKKKIQNVAAVNKQNRRR
jgi:hypothetical protein